MKDPAKSTPVKTTLIRSTADVTVRVRKKGTIYQGTVESERPKQNLAVQPTPSLIAFVERVEAETRTAYLNVALPKKEDEAAKPRPLAVLIENDLVYPLDNAELSEIRHAISEKESVWIEERKDK